MTGNGTGCEVITACRALEQVGLEPGPGPRWLPHPGQSFHGEQETSKATSGVQETGGPLVWDQGTGKLFTKDQETESQKIKDQGTERLSVEIHQVKQQASSAWGAVCVEGILLKGTLQPWESYP